MKTYDDHCDQTEAEPHDAKPAPDLRFTLKEVYERVKRALPEGEHFVVEVKATQYDHRRGEVVVEWSIYAGGEWCVFNVHSPEEALHKFYDRDKKFTPKTLDDTDVGF
jgi:hypothetical protein